MRRRFVNDLLSSQVAGGRHRETIVRALAGAGWLFRARTVSLHHPASGRLDRASTVLNPGFRTAHDGESPATPCAARSLLADDYPDLLAANPRAPTPGRNPVHRVTQS